MNVRFDLTDEKQRRTAEALQKLDRKKYQSINAFVVEAVSDYLDRLDRSDDLSLDSIRAMFREELRSVSFIANNSNQTKTVKDEMTEEEKAKNDASVLAALQMFG